jgi:hypothetical protein
VREAYARDTLGRVEPDHGRKRDVGGRTAETKWNGQRQTLRRTIGDLDASLPSVTAERNALAASLNVYTT